MRLKKRIHFFERERTREEEGKGKTKERRSESWR
jgi:hypothetical protein